MSNPEITETCAETVWDLYAFECGRQIVNGECGRHGPQAKRRPIRPVAVSEPSLDPMASRP